MDEQKLEKLARVVYVHWEESERGWGIRPDGCSLHLSVEDFTRFEQEYWQRMPATTLDEYSRPATKPRGVCVTQTLYQLIAESEHGIWLSQNREREAKKNGELYI